MVSQQLTLQLSQLQQQIEQYKNQMQQYECATQNNHHQMAGRVQLWLKIKNFLIIISYIHRQPTIKLIRIRIKF